MSDIAFILGPVVFQDFEVAAGIGFGGEQRLAVHKLPGGVRVIDALGRDDAEITVNGIFSGEDATLRARLLDELRASGAVLPLTWDVFFYSVVIRNFQADYQNGYWIPYRLACTVLRDEASALIETAISLAGSVLSDIGAAAMSGFDLGGVDLGFAQSALSAPQAMTRGTGAYGLATSSLATAQSAIGGGIAGAEQPHSVRPRLRSPQPPTRSPAPARSWGPRVLPASSARSRPRAAMSAAPPSTCSTREPDRCAASPSPAAICSDRRRAARRRDPMDSHRATQRIS